MRVYNILSYIHIITITRYATQFIFVIHGIAQNDPSFFYLDKIIMFSLLFMSASLNVAKIEIYHQTKGFDCDEELHSCLAPGYRTIPPGA